MKFIAIALVLVSSAVSFNASAAKPQPDHVINDTVFLAELRAEMDTEHGQKLRRKLLAEAATDRTYSGNAELVGLDIELLGHDAPAWRGAMCDQLQPKIIKTSARLQRLCR